MIGLSLSGRDGAHAAVPNLDERDPDVIRERLPALWMLFSMYFRGDVRGVGNIPDEGPVLLVGNHSGGGTSPDTLLLLSAFSTYFGVERPIFALTRTGSRLWPATGWLRRLGVCPPSPGAIDAALRAGASVVAYPGGDEEAHRPSWQAGAVNLGDDVSWVTTALRHNVPIVPVVAAGGQETALFLGRLAGRSVALGLPFGVHVGGLTSPVPLPAKLTLEVLHPVDVRATYGDDPDPRRVRSDIAVAMQRHLSWLQRGRRLPVLG